MTQSPLPRHVAIIIDGNGRWAKKHRVLTAAGHHSGLKNIRTIALDSLDLGIEVLSFYVFSTENWRRSPQEVQALMELLLQFFTEEIDEMVEKNVRLRILGDKDGMPPPQREALIRAEELTASNTGMRLNFAINYGGRAELARAARLLAEKAVRGEITPDEITEAALARELYTHDLPDVDLMIRTSGEMRLSNFLLFQCAYAEFLFPETLWPDFDPAAYHAALEAFAKRDRRFGGRNS